MIRGGAFFRLLLFASLSNAVPLLQRHIRSTLMNGTDHLMECVSDDVVYHRGDQVPSPGPCEQCYCEPPNVICTMIKCKVNSGCKTIQRANHCCPDYKCDCEYNGKIYNNGERLDRPDDPCQVCYCKGGEVMCTSVTCYEREDCKPHFIPGQCCPKYDHCPVESRRFTGNSIRSVNSTAHGSKREMQPWLLTKAVSVQPKETVSTESYPTIKEVHTTPLVINKYPQTIEIREILPTLSTSGGIIGTETTTRKAHGETISLKLHNTKDLNEEDNIRSRPQTEIVPSSASVSSKEDFTENLDASLSVDYKTTESTEGTDPDNTTTNSSNGETTEDAISTSTVEVSKKKIEAENQGSTQTDNSKFDPFSIEDINENVSIIQDSSTMKSRVSFPTTSPPDLDVGFTRETYDEDAEIVSTHIPTVDLIMDHHNSTFVPEIILPTSETFSSPDVSDEDTETTEFNIYAGSSTDLLKGGIYKDLIQSLTSIPEDVNEKSTNQFSDTTINNDYDSSTTFSPNYGQTTDTFDQTANELNETTSTEKPGTTSLNGSSFPQFIENFLPDNSPKKHTKTTQSDLNDSEENSREIEETSREEFPKFTDSSSMSEVSKDSSFSNSDLSIEKTEAVSELNGQENYLTNPPILQLNDQIQYLKVGGHHEETEANLEDMKSPVIHVDIYNINPKSTPCNVSTLPKSNANKFEDSSKDSVTVSHVILTPNDLKDLVERFISDKGKTNSENLQTAPSIINESSIPILSSTTNSDSHYTDNYTSFQSSPETNTSDDEIDKLESDISILIRSSSTPLMNTESDIETENETKSSSEDLGTTINNDITNLESLNGPTSDPVVTQNNFSSRKSSQDTENSTDTVVLMMEELSSTTVAYGSMLEEIKQSETSSIGSVLELNNKSTESSETTEKTEFMTVTEQDSEESTHTTEQPTEEPEGATENSSQDRSIIEAEDSLITTSEHSPYDQRIDSFISNNDSSDASSSTEQSLLTPDERDSVELLKHLSLP